MAVVCRAGRVVGRERRAWADHSVTLHPDDIALDQQGAVASSTGDVMPPDGTPTMRLALAAPVVALAAGRLTSCIPVTSGWGGHADGKPS